MAVRLAPIERTVPIAAQAVTAGTPVDLYTPATGRKFRVTGYALSLTVAGSVILKEGTGGAGTELLRTPLMAAGAGMPSGPRFGVVSVTPGNKLQLDVSATGSVSGHVVLDPDE